MTRDEVIREMAAANQATRFDFRGCPTSVEHESLPEAAMRSALARAEELGWKLLPREPSEDMDLRGCEADHCDWSDHYEPSNQSDSIRDIYQAMYDAEDGK